jgi:DNA polymerase-3 subunit epsilon
MLARMRQALGRRRLKQAEYGYLFDQPVDDDLVVFDCETTDLNVDRAELLTIGAVRIEGRRIKTSSRLELLIKPDANIDVEAIKVHHLRHIDVENGLPPRRALHAFLEFIGSRPLVGYYLEFDVAMINKYLRPWLGVALPNRQIEVSSLYYDYVQRKYRGHPWIGNVDLRFDRILEALELPVRPAHDACNDALMTAMMYLKLRELAE